MSQCLPESKTYFVRLLILAPIFLNPLGLSAQPAPEGPNLPDPLVEFFNELKLGVQVHGGPLRWTHTAPPMANEDLRFLKQPMSGDLSFATPLYGASGALRYQGAEVRLAYRANVGMRPSSYLTWRSGQPAIPIRPKIGDLEIRTRYMITGWMGLEGKYKNQLVDLTQDRHRKINGKNPAVLFDGRVRRTSFRVAVPLRFRWGRALLFGSVGTAVSGRSRQRYNVRFLLHDEDVDVENPDRLQEALEGNLDLNRQHDTGFSSQFLRTGVSYPILGATVRLSASVTRVDVPSVSANWHVGTRLEVGVPF